MGRGEFSEPFLLINFKTYLEATGKRAVDLSRKIEEVGRNAGVKVGVAPQFCDIAQVAGEVEIPVFAQHIDPITPGAYTGHVLPESVRAAGAAGTIINHSERTIRLIDIENSVRHARELGLLTVVCASTARLSGAGGPGWPGVVCI